MMKNITIILILVITTLSCKAQIIIPIEEQITYKNNEIEFPEGAYIKDVNNLLDRYVGSWKGTYNNKNYEFEIVKYTRISDISTRKFDKLLMRYKITDSNGTVIANTLNLPNESYYVIRGRYLRNDGGGYVLNYVGFSDCGQNGTVFISTYNNDTKMRLGLYVNGELGLNCTTGAEQVLPTSGGIDLIKQ